MLAIVVGLILTARPTFLLISPLVASILGWRRSAVAAIVAAGSIMSTWPWPAMRFATNPSAKLAAIGIFILALIMTVVVKAKRDKILGIGFLLCLPAFMSSCNAQHLLFALPFLVAATLKKDI
jgi:hypothetical protein